MPCARRSRIFLPIHLDHITRPAVWFALLYRWVAYVLAPHDAPFAPGDSVGRIHRGGSDPNRMDDFQVLEIGMQTRLC